MPDVLRSGRALDIVAAFVRDGLSTATKVICVTESIPPEQLTAELSERGVPVAEALPTNQLMIFSTDETWLAGGELTAATMMARISGYPRRRGAAGLHRTAAVGRHVLGEPPIAAADQLPVFESEVGKFFGEGRLTAVCQYDREIFDAVTLAFATATHARVVAAAVYYEDPVLRICRQHVPPGVRIAGELDFHHIDELTLALNEALQLDRDVQVNLAKLRFIDARGGVDDRARRPQPAPRPRNVGPVCRVPYTGCCSSRA
jgi:hypothetical protein